jgi:hypothetical protein
MNMLNNLSRRQALTRFGAGFGGLALGSLLADSAPVAAASHIDSTAHFPATS